jgi:hypothetical protein
MLVWAKSNQGCYVSGTPLNKGKKRAKEEI